LLLLLLLLLVTDWQDVWLLAAARTVSVQWAVLL